MREARSVDTVIITPTLGNRESLVRTVDSVQQVGGERVKHVLVCPQHVQNELRDRFPHCEVMAEPNKSGVYGAVNTGLNAAKQDCLYVGYINDDDSWLKDFHRLFDVLDQNRDVSIAYARVLFVDCDGKPIFESTSSEYYKSFKYLLARGAVSITQQATLFRREVFERLGGFDCSYSIVADNDFWLRAIEAGFKMEYVNCVCATFMLQPGQLSSNREQAGIELEHLLKQHAITKDWRAFYEFMRFRIQNIPNYWKRLKGNRLMDVKSLLRE
ncbi:MAG: glycosyltransferase [Pirellulaceae bacterium]|nr:glycosyltransferase [Pirellulaceae bacterium]